ncbi:class I SAM-dependent methyltransferase [Tepidiphilus olei]|uniref:class I SAM-dependent methyltransferase n=1 Tax=Tepidiphilus olei TaxID=2502184 RepID=UPI00115CB125|nr:class I SAM-dependent methyltransferase [Tepidiphilus olei]
MSDWTAGYVADIGYTYGYYNELNPLRIKLAFLNQGLVFPEVGSACELGFGQGLSVNCHAAASVTQWHGTDFNPSQASFAQELAAASGAGAKLYDQAFADFCHRPDLPDFDYIGLHGIWSWISDDNRAVIVDFIRRKLKVGGVLYISYNTLPGWASFAPMRHLMAEHAQAMGAAGTGIVSRIDGAIAFAEKLLATNPLFSRANPLVGERFKKLKEQNRHYLAHEYFNRDWHPMHFATMAEWLTGAKMQYACSAHYLDHVEAINLTAEQQALLRDIPDPMFRETTRDFMVNQQFRRDYWVKGARRLSMLEQAEALRSERLVLVVPRDRASLKVTGSLGEANLQEAIYVPILDELGDHKPKTLGQLASPVTGGGVPVSRFEQLFLLARQSGHKTLQDWARFAWSLLAAQGQRLVKEGKPLETPDDNLAELSGQASEFAEKRLPLLKSLGVA